MLKITYHEGKGIATVWCNGKKIGSSTLADCECAIQAWKDYGTNWRSCVLVGKVKQLLEAIEHYE